MSSFPIYFEGTVSKDIIEKAHKLDGSEFKVKMKLLVVFSISYFLCFIVITDQSDGNFDSSHIFTLILTLIITVGILWFSFARMKKKNYSQKIDEYGKGEITKASIKFTNNDSSSDIGWNLFKSINSNSELVLLYGQKGSGIFLVFHKSFFSSEADWRLFSSVANQIKS